MNVGALVRFWTEPSNDEVEVRVCAVHENGLVDIESTEPVPPLKPVEFFKTVEGENGKAVRVKTHEVMPAPPPRKLAYGQIPVWDGVPPRPMFIHVRVP